MASSEQDENSAGGDGAAQLAGVLAEGLDAVALQLAGHILCRVVAGLQKGRRENKTRIKTTDLSLGLRNYTHISFIGRM